jgi:hypothetical protein
MIEKSMQPEMKLVVELSTYPTKLTKIDISSLSEDKIIKLLVANQVMLPFLKNLNHFSNSELSSIKDKIQDLMKKDYVLDLDKKIPLVLSILDELNVEYMMHKHLFYEREQGDLDILVPVEKFDYVVIELKKQGFTPTSHESYKIGMTKFEDNTKFTVHVHAKIKWESEFISTEDVWKRSRQIMILNKLVRIPSAEDSILIECAHAFFEARLLRLCDVLQFLELLKHDSIDWQKINTRLIEYRYQSAGYLYLIAMDHLIKKFFKNSPIPQIILDDLEQNISKLEKITAVNHAKKKILSEDNQVAPLRISLLSSTLIFVSFNRHLGMTKLVWSMGVILSAAIRHLEVKLGLRKL